MSDYKVIFRADAETKGEVALTWEPGCPLAFEAIQVARNVQTGKAFLQAKVMNVSDAVVNAFKASFEVVRHDGTVERVDSELLDADISPVRSFNLTPMALAVGDVKLVRGAIDWVRTPDGAWSSSAAPTPISRPKSLGLSERALGERYEQLWASTATASTEPYLRKAAENGIISDDNWWVCPCGQPNVNRKRCANCGVSYERLVDPGAQNQEALEAAADKREAEAKEAARKTRKKRRITIFVSLVAVLVLIAVMAAVFVMPNLLKYNQGLQLLERGEYAEAGEAFSSLGDYLDAKDLAEGAWFGEMLEPYMGADRETAFYEGPRNEELSYQYLCVFTINIDGSCSVTFPEESQEYAGTWQGTWDMKTWQISLPGFPSGELFYTRHRVIDDRNYLELDIAGVDTQKEDAEVTIFLISEDGF